MNILPTGPLHPQVTGSQPAAGGDEQGDKGRKVAEQFSSILMSMVVKEMFQTVSLDDKSPFGNGPGADVYRGLAESSFADALTRSGLGSLTNEIHNFIRRSQHQTESKS